MAKDKIQFVCQECGYESTKWLGKCPDCGKWNTFVEEKKIAASKTRPHITNFSSEVKKIDEITGTETLKNRYRTGINEFDNL